MQRLLVIKLADIGDLLTATPGLRSLRATFPAAHIALLTTPHAAPLLEGAGLVDEVRVLAKAQFDHPLGLLRPDGVAALGGLAGWLRSGRFDAVLLMHHLTTAFGRAKYRALLLATGAPIRAGLDNGFGEFLTHRAVDRGFGAQHEVAYCADVAALLGAARDLGSLVFPVQPEHEEAAAALLGGLGGAPRVAVHPGAGGFSLARRWGVEKFGAVARSLAESGYRVVVVGGPDEAALASTVAAAAGPDAINLAGKTSLRVLGAVLQRCDAYLGNDSGVTHIAAAVGTPVAAVFGPTNHQAWGPWTGGAGRAVVLRAHLPCSPCMYRGHALGTPEGCPRRTCLQLVTPEQVTAAVLALLQESPGSAERG